jgi:hypothetical protein
MVDHVRAARSPEEFAEPDSGLNLAAIPRAAYRLVSISNSTYGD